MIGDIDTFNISNIEYQKKAVQDYTTILEILWNKHFKFIKITKHFKTQQNNEYNTKLNIY